MYFKAILDKATSYYFGNKIDENGLFVDKEKAEKVDVVLPPKKKESYKTIEEYNKALDDYKKFQEELNKYGKAVEKTANGIMNPKNVFSEEKIEKIIKQANEINKKNNPNLVIKESVKLTTKEKMERQAIRNDAVDIISKASSLSAMSSVLLKNYLNGVKHYEGIDRETFTFFAVGCRNVDDLYRDYDILVNGSEKEKTEMFSRKTEALKKAVNVVTEQKTDAEYVSSFKDTFFDVYVLTTLQGENIERICKELGITPSQKDHDYIIKNAGAFVNAGVSHNILGNIANPYYTICNENIGHFENAFSSQDVEDYVENFPEKYAELKEMKAATMEAKMKSCSQAIKDGTQAVSTFDLHMSNLSFMQTLQGLTKDHLSLYFEKNNGNINMIRDHKGNMFKGDKDALAEKANKILLEDKKPLFVYDKNGKFRYMVSLPDDKRCAVPKYNTEKLEKTNFKMGPKETIKNLKEELKKCDSIFSSDHQEYINLKKYINNMDKLYDSGAKTMNMMCEDLRLLATKYLESKYAKEVPNKTDRTYYRENFMCKLINSIDEKYPLTYESLENKPLNTTLKEQDEVAKEVIKMNHDGVERAKVEEYVSNKIEEKQKITVELDDANENVEKEGFEKVDSQVKEVMKENTLE